MNNIVIRKGKIEDLFAIQKLSNELGEQSYDFDHDLSHNWANTKAGQTYYEERLIGEKGLSFVAEVDGRIIGFTSCTIHEPDDWRLIKRVEIDNIFIDESFRGQGIGKLLIEAVKNWAKKIKASRIILNAFTDNKKAILFYEREGFIQYETILQLILN